MNTAISIYHSYNWIINRNFADFEPDYRGPMLDVDELTVDYYSKLRSVLPNFPHQPLISIVVPVYKVSPELLRDTLASVATQVYERWELCIVDDASKDPNLTEVIEAFARRHAGKVKFKANEVNGHISVTSNRCLEMATGEYVALLDHDDRLTPNALGEMIRYINMYDGPDILYSDERIISPAGNALNEPFLKPDWSPFLHLSVNYTTHLSVYRLSLLQKIGGFRAGYEGSQDHDLMLRATENTQKKIVHVPFVLYQWRAIKGSTASGSDAKPYAAIAGVKAVTESCTRRGMPAVVEWEPRTGHYRMKFELPKALPLISIIIPTKNCLELIKPCLETVFGKTTYRNFEVLVVDNGTTDERTLAFLAQMQAEQPTKLRVIRDDGPFNFAIFNNRAARQAKGEYLVLLNNDTEVVTGEWLEELLGCAQHSSVGAVGCKLIYPDMTLQHAGVLLIDRRVAGHALTNYPADTNVYFGMAQTLHETSAITAACMMISKKKFLEVDGLDEVYLPNGFGDVDFCLKLRRAGYTCLYTPYATLVHHESKTRGRNIEAFEKRVMLERWGHELVNEPYLHFQFDRKRHYMRSNDDMVLDPSNVVMNFVARATLNS